MYKAAKRHFKKNDPILYAAAKNIQLEDGALSDDLFRDIIWTIVGQQLSSVAANTIFARFQALFKGKSITPARILKLPEEVMRAAGLSGAKVRAIKHTAEAAKTGHLDVALLPTLKDDEIILELTKIKGIGPWTAEMLLMFSLGRTDIFSKGDLGLKKGIIELYGVNIFASEKKLEKLLLAWSPYRSFAARILWKVADKNKNRIARKRPL